jgi:hypothetical protein
MAEQEMHLGPGRQGLQPFRELERLDEQARDAVAPGPAQFHQDPPVRSGTREVPVR